MKLCVIGTGYVGLITGCGFASMGHDVTCVDIDKAKVDMINSGKSPIFEKGLDELLRSVAGKKLRATTDLGQAAGQADVIFITVGTPSRKDGSIDASYVRTAFVDALGAMDSYKVLVVKSTVVPGTTESLAKLGKEKTGREAGKDYGFCMNPEFLREGRALDDFREPDRIVIGAGDAKAMERMLEIYSQFKCPLVKTTIRTAEMIKYASNAFLATKISFANEFGNLCKELGIDTYEVMDAIGMDKRIGRQFLNSGIGYGGSCFPKDVKAIIHSFHEAKVKSSILESVLEVNASQPLRIVELAKRRLGPLKGRKVSVLGLAFKPGTDDMRESPAMVVVDALLKEGALVKAYDPQAMDNAGKILKGSASLARTMADALAFSDTVFILTEWDEFKDAKLYAGKTVFDGRKVLDKKSGKDYEGVCW